MLWEKCLPTKFYEHVKKPDNFFILNSGKLTFNQAKNIVLSYIQLPDTWKELTEIITKRQKVYQYVFTTVFPTTYLQINKYGIKIRNDFSLCFTEWLNENIKKEQLKQLGKTAANYTNNSNNEKRHPYEQKPIKKDNRDTWKELTEIITKRQKVYQYVFTTVFPTTYLQINKYGIKIRNDFSLCFTEWLNENIKKEQLKQLGKTAANYTNNSNNEKRHPYEQKIKNDNKEIIPPSESYKHFPTMAKINFDKKYALPTVKRKTYKTKNGERQNKKEELTVRLSEIDEKMKLIKSK